MKITLHGQPITKKNSQQIIMAGGRPCIIQSKAFRAYEKAVREQLRLIAYQTINRPIQVTTVYYMATERTPDLTNLMAATHDVLEHCGVIANDNLIKSVDGSRIVGKDSEPRVEIVIKEMP